MQLHEAALYPPPHSFHAGVGAPELHEAIARSNDDPIPKPITLAVLLPGSRGPARDADLARLHREIHGLARRVDRDRGIAELLVDATSQDQSLQSYPFAELLEAIERHIYAGPLTARTLLVGAPGDLIAPEDVDAFRAAGFNRLALGGARTRRDTVRTARLRGFRPIAMAIDCDAAGDASVSIRQAADAAISLRPDRLEIRVRADASLCSHVLGEAIRACVERVGYAFIGPDQYALEGDELALASLAGRMRFGVYGFTAAADCDVLGVGPGALSQVGNCLARNAPGLPVWRQATDSGRLPAFEGILLSEEDRIRDAVIQSLLCRRAIPIRELETQFHFTFRRRFALELANLARLPAAAHLRDTGARIEVRSPGWPWLRNMAQCFDLYASWRAPILEAYQGR
jgi:oxygen-independent coproporphyrinogen III oxidase